MVDRTALLAERRTLVADVDARLAAEPFRASDARQVRDRQRQIAEIDAALTQAENDTRALLDEWLTREPI